MARGAAEHEMGNEACKTEALAKREGVMPDHEASMRTPYDRFLRPARGDGKDKVDSPSESR